MLAREFILPIVSTVPEIAAAIEALSEPERQRLESWLLAQRFGDDAALERELAAAIREADCSPELGQSPDEVRDSIRQWTSESASKSAL